MVLVASQPSGDYVPPTWQVGDTSKKKKVVRAVIGLLFAGVSFAVGFMLLQNNPSPENQEAVPTKKTEGLAQILLETPLTDTLTAVRAYAQIVAIPTPGQEFVLNLGTTTSTASVKFSTQLYSGSIGTNPNKEGQQSVTISDIPNSSSATEKITPTNNTKILKNPAYLYALKPGDMITVVLLMHSQNNNAILQAVYFDQKFVEMHEPQPPPPYAKLNPFSTASTQLTPTTNLEGKSDEVIQDATVVSVTDNQELLVKTKDDQVLKVVLGATSKVRAVVSAIQNSAGEITTFETGIVDPRYLELLEEGNRVRLSYINNQSENLTSAITLTELLLYTF